MFSAVMAELFLIVMLFDLCDDGMCWKGAAYEILFGKRVYISGEEYCACRGAMESGYHASYVASNFYSLC